MSTRPAQPEQSNPDQVRAIVSALPVATGPKQAKKDCRGAMRKAYGPDWWRSDRTKGVYNRVLEAYIARNK